MSSDITSWVGRSRQDIVSYSYTASWPPLRGTPLKRLRSSQLSFLLATCLLLFCDVSFLGCSKGEPTTPEEEVRAILKEAEIGAEAKDIKPIKEMISESYSDIRGRTKADLKQVLAYHFFRNQSMHLAVRMDTIELLPSGEVQGVLFVAMANTPISSFEALANLRASMYRFDFLWRKEGDKDWKLIQSDWRKANHSDFIE